ncbi:MAG TPA: alpha/beta hydrolase [Acidimicrobiales bacterium]|jgi:acetyl esterase/lipase|nr:alpha/beta hydrolase [Acidimicrobiales bacterium]
MTNYVLETQAQEIVDALSNFPPLYEMSPVDARGVIDSVQGAPTERLDVDESWVTVPLEVGDVRVRIVKPKKATGSLPVILYLHGGGWVLGNAASHDRLVRELAVGVNAAVAFVEYSLAPEAKYPVQNEQAYGAARWITRHGTGEGLDPSRMAVAGDSAGGNMATVLTIMAKQRGDVEFAHQSLFYPATDASMDSESYRVFKDGPYLTANTMAWFWQNYLPDAQLGAEITVSPLRASHDDLQGLPPALVIVDENDVLRDEGEAYASKLREAGVPTTSVRYNGIIHDFMMLNALSGTQSTRAAIAQAVTALRQAFGTATN